MPVRFLDGLVFVVRFARGQDAHSGEALGVIVGGDLHDGLGAAINFLEEGSQLAHVEAAVLFEDADVFGLDALIIAACFLGAKSLFAAGKWAF